MPRPLSNDPRCVARRTGENYYNGICDTHGPALFGVQSAKCMKCFTAGGSPRKPVRTYDV
jgi:hypothetical protein